MAGALKFSAIIFLLVEFGLADQLAFDESEFIRAGERTRSVVAGDFKADGDLDLIVLKQIYLFCWAWAMACLSQLFCTAFDLN